MEKNASVEDIESTVDKLKENGDITDVLFIIDDKENMVTSALIGKNTDVVSSIYTAMTTNKHIYDVMKAALNIFENGAKNK